MATPPINYSRHYQRISACVKLLCERIGFIEPLCLSEAMFNLRRACRSGMGRVSIALDVSINRKSSLLFSLLTHTDGDCR